MISKLIKEQGFDESLEKAFRKLKQEDKALYHELVDEIYEGMHGHHFNKELSKKAVDKMENVDGTFGEKWTQEQVENLLVQNNTTSTKFNKYDFYYVMNMLHSDYQKVLGNDTNVYFRLALAWLDDIDAPCGKAYKYYKRVIKGE